MFVAKAGLTLTGLAAGLALAGCVAVNPAPQPDHVTVQTRPQPTVIQPAPVVVTPAPPAVVTVP